jgi:putative ABC transport system permease protein
MLKNYFKIAIAVLNRRKFFTFISLFGISITLAILMVLTSFLDHLFAPKYPDYERARSLYVNFLTKVGGENNSSRQSGPMSAQFINKYISTLKTPERVAVYSMFVPTNAYINSKKLTLQLKYTNAEFWKVLRFDFIEGKPYDAPEISRGDFVAVITNETARSYFGEETNVVGKYIETDNERYRVIGVVKGVPITKITSYGDIFVPYTLPKSNFENRDYNGMYSAIILAKSKSDIPAIQEEFANVLKKIPLENPKQFHTMYCYPDKYVESFTRLFFKGGDDSGVGFFYAALTIIVLLFMLLPTINLVNINISRIMERSSEIGVRKAFGASSGKLVVQFIVENIILTLLGGIIAVILSLLVIYFLNNSGVIAYLDLTMNLPVLAVSLLLCLVFGIISGVYPAWRMSRLQVVDALKS